MSTLTLEQLKKSNPRLYSQCIDVGIQKERERCMSLLPNHTGNAVSRYAIKCIENGSPLECREQANYLCMQMNAFRRDKESDIVASMVEANLGVSRDENINH